MICFTWWGLTQYAARAIEAFNKVSKEQVIVVATRPKSSPVEGMERILTCPIIWVEENETDILSRLSEVPRVVFVSNWNLLCFRPIEDAVRARKGVIVAMIDTDFKFNLREVVRAVRFRLMLRHRFNKFFCVGASGEKLLRLYGVPKSIVFKGLYGADSSLFKDGLPLAQRLKRIIYVGQFIARKNVLRLVEAFKRFHDRHPEWELEMCGHGVLHDQIPKMPGLIVHDFVQPEELAALYRNARAFVLPSLEEHWGVVVHEAALSGCYLLLSRCIGAGADFAVVENSAMFDPLSVDSIVEAFEHLANLKETELEDAQKMSIAKASRFGLARFVEAVCELIKEG